MQLSLFAKFWKPRATVRGALTGSPPLLLLRTGAKVEAVFAAPPGDPVEFFLVDQAGHRSPAAHEERRPVAMRLDLLNIAPEGGWKWRRQGGGPKARDGVNFAQGWRLADADTAYLRTQGVHAAELLLPDEHMHLAPGSSYRFSVLAAVHRCRAAVVLEVVNAQGQVLQTLERGVSATARGGRERAGYDLVQVVFTAPGRPSRLRVKLRKGGGRRGEDSFLFAAEPQLVQDGDTTRGLAGASADDVARLAQAMRSGARLDLVTVRVATQHGGPAADARLVLRCAGVDVAHAPLAAIVDPQPAEHLWLAPAKAAMRWNRRELADGRRIAAARAWLRRASEGRRPPDLERLVGIVDGEMPVGVIDFPHLSDPAAAVILRGGQDPERLLRTLAALRLAANVAEFTVAVVIPQELAGRVGAAVGRIEIAAYAGADGESGALAQALDAAAALPVVLLEAGLEPVSGWLDELLAARANFPGVEVVGGKVIAADGMLEQAGALSGQGSGPEWIGSGGGARDPAFGYVRPVDVVSPAMAPAPLWRQALGPEGCDLVAMCSRVRQDGGAILYVPTAEFWRLANPAGEQAAWPLQAPDRDPPDRPKLPRVLFIDQEAPTVDMDAGGYASFQEMRLLQAAGCRVDFFPKNLAWMDRHTLALERAGVRCIYAPFARDFDGFLRQAAGVYDAIFVVRYKVALLVQAALEPLEHRPPLILNLADLHFLREEREAAAGTPGYTPQRAGETRKAELGAIAAADLTLTYSPVEAEVIRQQTQGRAAVGRAPWTAETLASPAGSFGSTWGLLFLGGFGHPPNAEAARIFVREVMPRLGEALPDVALRIVGSKPTSEVLALAAANIEVLGYVADLDEVFAQARIFVAPLLAGAGLKGKVVEAMTRGVPMVLTPVAAEATGLTHRVDCLIAETPQQQADAIIELYTDAELWARLARASLDTARRQFGFEQGVAAMRAALEEAGVRPPAGPHLHYRRARPDRAHGASAAPAVLRLP